MLSKRLISSKRFRLVLSLLIVAHLAAIFLPPLSLQTRGPLGQSPSVAALLGPIESYGQFLYIDRGYAFFAPDPGPSHLLQVAISDPSKPDATGAASRVELMYPDRGRQWPRLLYHRHFMLTEFLYEIYQPPLPEDVSQLEADELTYWRNARSRYEHFRQSMIRHLEYEYPDREIAIRRIEHLIPDLVAYRERPVPLNDLESYRVLLDQGVELPPSIGDDDVNGSGVDLERETSGVESDPSKIEAIPMPSSGAWFRDSSAPETPLAIVDRKIEEKHSRRSKLAAEPAHASLRRPLDAVLADAGSLGPSERLSGLVGAGS